jgi:general secretion pathway protein J
VCSSERGFTLIELLVAMAIFAVIGALALGGLNAVTSQISVARAQVERLADLQRAMRIISADLQQLSPRPVRDELGRGVEPALMTGGAGGDLIRFTRDGWSNPAELPRSRLQRVQYRVEDEILVREYWRALDHPLGVEPISNDLIAGVSDVEISFLTQANDWETQWPPLQGAAQGGPRAVRIGVELLDYGMIERTFEVVQ